MATDTIYVDFATGSDRLSAIHATALDGRARLRLNADVINDDGIAGHGARCSGRRAHNNGTPRDGHPPAGVAARDEEMPRCTRNRSPARGSDIARQAALRPAPLPSHPLDPLLASAARGALVD